MLKELFEPDTESMIDVFIEFLNSRYDAVVPARYFIAECFTRKGIFSESTYEIDNLIMVRELDGTMVNSIDDDEKLIEDLYSGVNRVLAMFPIEEVLYIGFKDNMATISFSDGYIVIKQVE